MSFLDSLRGVRWPARRAVERGVAGAHRSRQRGSSPETVELRTYRQGDDPRRLDWRLLARTDRAYVRLTTGESLLATAIVVDASASMGAEPDDAKWVMASRISLGLAAAAHAGGDPVGVTIARDSAARALPPRNRRGTVAEIARLLDDNAPTGGGAVVAALATLGAVPRVALVSDFLGEEDAIVGWAARRRLAGGEVYAIHIVSATELDPGTRSRLMVDPERADVRRPLGAATLAEYQSRFSAWRDALARRFRDAGAMYTLVVSDEPADRAVRRIVAPAHVAIARP